MIILFEGLDKCGKTTIAKELSKCINVPYFKKPNDSDSLKGTYNPEYSLIYETRKFIEFLDFKVIKNIILDRDYVSEYVYGYLFRKEKYEKMDIKKYISIYDKLLYHHNIIIVYCYKSNFKNFDDKYVKLEDKEKIEKRYLQFLDKTYNRVIFLDTTDENINNQIDYLIDRIEIYRNLYNYNKSIYENYSLTNKKIFFPGSFNGTDVLFVGQNPGQPNKDDKQGIKIHTKKFDNFGEFMLEHDRSYRKSKYFKFIEMFSKNKLGLISNKQFSFTNVVKYSTEDNRSLTSSEIRHCKDILFLQIDILNPKKIITFGKDAHRLLVDNNIKHDAYIHPSYFKYQKTEKIK